MAKNDTQEHRDARFLQEIESLRAEIEAEQAELQHHAAEARQPQDAAPEADAEADPRADAGAAAEQGAGASLCDAKTPDASSTEEAEQAKGTDAGNQADEAAKGGADEESKPADKPKRKRDRYKDDDFRSTLRELRNFTNDESEDRPLGRPKTLNSLLGGDIFAMPWFRHQIPYFIMVLLMLFVYVNNRYTCQSKLREQSMLNDTLLDRRYKALTRSSQLKECMRRGYIEKVLTDTTLQTSNTPSYNLKVEEDE